VAVTSTYRPQGDRINVGNIERWLSTAAGGALAAWALKRRDTPAGGIALGAAALLYRGATGHCHVYQALGVNHGDSRNVLRIADRNSDTRRQLGGERGIHVDESILVNRPIAEVYRFWRNFENLPRFMEHLDAVAVRDEGVEWDARIINEVENQVIGWQSLAGSRVSTAGSVNFDETGHGTSVRVHLQYNPPGGRLGAAVAWIFGEEPTQTVREDLRRFKRLLETGEIPTTEGQPSGRTSARGARGKAIRREWNVAQQRRAGGSR
jgi:uncharacterized membrane protein